MALVEAVEGCFGGVEDFLFLSDEDEDLVGGVVVVFDGLLDPCTEFGRCFRSWIGRA